MRIQRPLILTDKDRMYGNTFEMAQRNDHLYQIVQPLEAGRITFTSNDRDKKYNNNLSRQSQKNSSELQTFWDVLILLCVLLVVVGCIAMSIVIGTQTTFNDVYLTQFKHDINNAHEIDTIAYSLEHAGHIKPLPYIIIALLCICSSIVVGWQSNPDLVLDQMRSNAVALFIVALQAWGLVFHAIVYSDILKTDQIMLTVSAVFWLHVAAIGITTLVVYYHSQLDHSVSGEPEQETVSTFWLTVAEDLNTIVCYVCVVSACNALGSVHDDTTIFFDVVCVVMIGFSQHIANVLMIFHGYVDSCSGNDQRDTVVTVIARTRLFIFFVIGVVVVVFFLRISPTYDEFTLGIPYEMIRVLAIVTMVSVSTFHSICYELQHATNVGKSWESSPSWKLMIVAFIAVAFSAYVWRSAALDNNADVRNFLNDPTTS